jgi:hypothetical protein
LTRDGRARQHHHVIELRPDPARGSGSASRIDGERRCPSNVIGSHPEHETDHGPTLDSKALIGGRVSRAPRHAVRSGQLTLEGLVSRRDVVAGWIRGEQIDAHAPQVRPVPDPVHEVTAYPPVFAGADTRMRRR